MFEKGRHGLKEYFNNEMNSLQDFIHTPVSQAFRQVQKQLSATAFVVVLS
jgi:flagellar biosynthesis/type III secretory pathway protein FliH